MKAKAIFLILGVILGLKTSYAYQFTEDFVNGIYWRNFPITMKTFVDTASEGSVLSQLISEAEQEWENSTGTDIWSFPDSYEVSNSYSGNYIRWSNNFAEETGYSPISTLAVTIRYRVGTYFTQTEIILNGENAKLRANQNGILYQTILHELGHTIGIDHSEYTSAVMYASLQGIDRLSFDDQEAILALMDQTVERQETGYISALATETRTDKNALACGSVAFINSDDNNNGPGNGALTVVFGFLLTLLFSQLTSTKATGRQKLPILISRD